MSKGRFRFYRPCFSPNQISNVNLYILNYDFHRLKFCDICDSKIIRTRIGNKCPKCDKQELAEINKMLEQQKSSIIYNDENFPFEKGQYYLQKDVRKKLKCGLMSGINYNKEGNFLVIFMNAHNIKTQEQNPYLDRYDPETGLYHYTGRGKKGNQTLAGVNEKVAKSNVNKTDIHFFRQLNVGSNHQYIGKVKLEKTTQTIQPDEAGQSRKVYEFLLRPVN